MSENKDKSEKPKIKVKREKRRLYEVNEDLLSEKTKSEQANVDPNSQPGKKKTESKKPKKSSQPKVKIQGGVISQKGERYTKASADAEKIIHRYVLMAGASGLIPIPVLDLVSTTSLQIAMVKKISDAYEITFKENEGKAFMLSMLAGVASTSAPRSAFGSLVKSVPGVGGLLGAFVMPGICAATTFALGKVFIQHFESGGTFLTLKAHNLKPVFDEALKNAKSANKSK